MLEEFAWPRKHEPAGSPRCAQVGRRPGPTIGGAASQGIPKARWPLLSPKGLCKKLALAGARMDGRRCDPGRLREPGAGLAAESSSLRSRCRCFDGLEGKKKLRRRNGPMVWATQGLARGATQTGAGGKLLASQRLLGQGIGPRSHLEVASHYVKDNL